MMTFAEKLDIRNSLFIQLILKRSKVIFFLRKIKESEECLDWAENELHSLLSSKTFIGDEKNKLEYLQQKIYFQRATIFYSGEGYEQAANFLYKSMVFFGF